MSGTGKGAPLTLGQVLRLTAGFWRPHLKTGIVLVAVLAVPQLFKAFFAYSQRLLVDQALLGRDFKVLVAVIAALAAGFLLAAAAQLAADYLTARVSAAILNGIRLRMFEHMQRLSVGFYTGARAGDLVARFTSDLADIQKSLTIRVVDAALATLGLLINVPVAFALDWRLACVMLAGAPVIGLGTRLFGRRAAAARYALKQEEGALASTVQESVRAQPVVKVFGLASWLLERFGRHLAELRARFVRAELTAELVGSASSLGVLSVQVLVVGVGAWLAFRGDLTTGALVAFITLHALVSKDAYDLTKKVVPSLIAASGGLQRIEELLAAPAEVSSRPGAPPLPRVRGPLRLEGVTFAYAGGSPVLAEVDLEIGPGEHVALVGSSGSGKSTVLMLLLRFWDPQRGRVTADGVDLRSVALSSLYEQMAAVFQESFLFDETIRVNIALGRAGATPAEVEAAARAAEVHDAIASLPDGYETRVGELGGRLSGGQRQRIAIARAVLRDPAVLFLDEATSALDPATEAAVNQTLRRLGRGRIVVSVTHRLAAAQGADRIVVLDGGRVAEQGTHAELLARGGIYGGLWDKQHGVEVSPDGAAAAVRPDFLAAVPILAGLDAATLADLARRLVSERWDGGQDVVCEGEAGDRFFIVARGKLEVLVGAHRLAVLADGDFFGEAALLTGAVRTATVRTMQPTLLLSLGRAGFQALLDEHPGMRARLEAAARRRELLLDPTRATPGDQPEARQTGHHAGALTDS